MANNCKFQKNQYQVSYDSGATWQNVVPEEVRKGELIEYDSSDCTSVEAMYRWRVLDGQYLCDGNNKYKKEIREESYNGGLTWYTSYPTTYRTGQFVSVDASFCYDKFVGHYIYDGSSETSKCPSTYYWDGYRCNRITDPIKVVKGTGTVLSALDTNYYTTGFSLTSCSIGTGVTEIESGCFLEKKNLTSVNIPSGVTSIGDSAFAGCQSLRSINLPNGITAISANTFSGCTRLETINIPSGVTTIGNHAFENCTSLNNITIPIYCRNITARAFFNCDGFTKLEVPTGYIGYQAFYHCSNLEELIIGEYVDSIDDYAFCNCSNLLYIRVNKQSPPRLIPTNNVFYRQFDKTNDCPIYVWPWCVNAFKSADGWSRYASRIQAIP